MNKVIISLISGALFGFGLAMSQMLNPEKVIGFLDITGDWDPSLAFVMIGALLVSFVSFKLILKRSTPIMEKVFHISRRTQIDKFLILGASLFGIGWGITGYCPGPAVAALGLGNTEAILMVISIFAGFYGQKTLEQFFSK